MLIVGPTTPASDLVADQRLVDAQKFQAYANYIIIEQMQHQSSYRFTSVGLRTTVYATVQ